MVKLSSPFPNTIGFSVLTHSNKDEQALLSELPPEEQTQLSNRAAPKRIRDFALGRLAAREALAQLGLKNPPPLLSAARGAPIWPDGYVGSITHAAGAAVAVAAHARDFLAIGIDLEDLSRQRRYDISSTVCREEELSWVAEVEELRAERTLRVFSAKESVYKALYPLCQTTIGFKDVSLSWDTAGGQFAGILHRQLSSKLPEGFRFVVGSELKDGFVFSHIALPAVR